MYKQWFCTLIIIVNVIVRCVNVQEEEEIQSLQKTISQMEAELDEEQNRLTEASTKLENSEKQLQKVGRSRWCRDCYPTETFWLLHFNQRWLGGAVVTALDLRLEIAGSIPAVALLSATLDKLFTHIVQRL